MKKNKAIWGRLFFITISMGILLATQGFCDDTWNGTNTTGDIWRTGNVGIGTSDPGAKLDISGENPYSSISIKDESAEYSMTLRVTADPDFAFVWNDGEKYHWGKDFRFDTSIEK